MGQSEENTAGQRPATCTKIPGGIGTGETRFSAILQNALLMYGKVYV
jgi:hypothetical protein